MMNGQQIRPFSPPLILSPVPNNVQQQQQQYNNRPQSQQQQQFMKKQENGQLMVDIQQQQQQQQRPESRDSPLQPTYASLTQQRGNFQQQQQQQGQSQQQQFNAKQQQRPGMTPMSPEPSPYQPTYATLSPAVNGQQQPQQQNEFLVMRGVPNNNGQPQQPTSSNNGGPGPMFAQMSSPPPGAPVFMSSSPENNNQQQQQQQQQAALQQMHQQMQQQQQQQQQHQAFSNHHHHLADHAAYLRHPSQDHLQGGHPMMHHGPNGGPMMGGGGLGPPMFGGHDMGPMSPGPMMMPPHHQPHPQSAAALFEDRLSIGGLLSPNVAFGRMGPGPCSFNKNPMQGMGGEKMFPKPAYSYSCLIALALKNSKNGSLPVSGIYNFMIEHFPYFRSAPDGWKNSVRHNLSLNKCFEKIDNPNKPNSGSKKGCLWTLNPAKATKMDEEIAKCRKRDPLAIKRSMATPDCLLALERGTLKVDSSGRSAAHLAAQQQAAAAAAAAVHGGQRLGGQQHGGQPTPPEDHDDDDDTDDDDCDDGGLACSPENNSQGATSSGLRGAHTPGSGSDDLGGQHHHMHHLMHHHHNAAPSYSSTDGLSPSLEPTMITDINFEAPIMDACDFYGEDFQFLRDPTSNSGLGGLVSQPSRLQMMGVGHQSSMHLSHLHHLNDPTVGLGLGPMSTSTGISSSSPLSSTASPSGGRNMHHHGLLDLMPSSSSSSQLHLQQHQLSPLNCNLSRGSSGSDPLGNLILPTHHRLGGSVGSSDNYESPGPALGHGLSTSSGMCSSNSPHSDVGSSLSPSASPPPAKMLAYSAASA